MNQQFQLPRITARDLEDTSCAKINSILDLLAKQIANSQGALGPIKFDTDLTARSVKLTRITPPQPTDAVMYKELSALVSVSVIDTHANRSTYSAVTYDGKFYYESDRKYFYLSDGSTWNYVAGVYHGATRPTDLAASDTGALFYNTTTTIESYWTGTVWAYNNGTHSAAIASIPTPSANEAGYLFYANDYKHLYVWSGSAWSYAESDSGSGYIVAGQSNGGLWALCDGSSTTIATATGTTTSATTPDLTGDVFLQGATSASSVRTAVRATWETTAKTEDESSHLHVFNNGGHPTSGPLGTPATVVVQSGTGTTVASDVHNHNDTSVNYNTGPGSAHSHALNDTNAQLKVPSETNGGLPKRIALPWYMRR